MATNAERQRDFRKRRDERIARMRGGLEAIAARLDGNDKPLAVELREIAVEALK